jgi:hypothetical protein
MRKYPTKEKDLIMIDLTITWIRVFIHRVTSIRNKCRKKNTFSHCSTRKDYVITRKRLSYMRDKPFSTLRNKVHWSKCNLKYFLIYLDYTENELISHILFIVVYSYFCLSVRKAINSINKSLVI